MNFLSSSFGRHVFSKAPATSRAARVGIGSVGRSSLSSSSATDSSSSSSSSRPPAAVGGVLTNAATDEVLVENTGITKRVVLNRPKALNALNHAIIRRLYPLYKEWQRQPGAVVIIKGQGDKAFCAGGDIRAIYDAGVAGDWNGAPRQFFRDEYRLNYLIAQQRFTHVALLNGIVMGGGVGMSVHGRYRICTENAVFAMPETGIGFFCDVGGSYFLSRLGPLGMYLALTGARLKGTELVTAGVATHFVPAAKLCDTEVGLIATPATQLDAVIAQFAQQPPQQLPHGAAESSSSEISRHKAVIDRCFSLPSVERIVEALQAVAAGGSGGADDERQWARCTLDTLLGKMSPTSLKVVHRQLTEGRQLSYAECFKMEYRISQAFMRPGSDFFEGVRALLVDKDKNPRWRPATLADVSDADVDAYFRPLAAADELTLDDDDPSTSNHVSKL